MSDEIIEMARQAGYKHPDAVGQCEDFAYFNLEVFAKLVEKRKCQELARKIQAMPFGDTAESFAIWVLEQA